MRTRLLHLFVAAVWMTSSLVITAAPSPSEPRTPRTPAHVQAFNRGTEHLLAMELGRAERQLRQALRRQEAFAEAHNNLAFVLRKQGEDHFAEALQHYNRAIELNAELAEAYMYRGVLYVHMGDAAAAEADREILEALNSSLAAELRWVIDHGHEKEPEHFFGVVQAIE